MDLSIEDKKSRYDRILNHYRSQIKLNSYFDILEFAKYDLITNLKAYYFCIKHAKTEEEKKYFYDRSLDNFRECKSLSKKIETMNIIDIRFMMYYIYLHTKSFKLFRKKNINHNMQQFTEVKLTIKSFYKTLKEFEETSSDDIICDGIINYHDVIEELRHLISYYNVDKMMLNRDLHNHNYKFLSKIEILFKRSS